MSMYRANPVVASVGTYPPTLCGIGSFTANTADAICTPASGWTSTVVRVIGAGESRARGGETHQWIEGDQESLYGAASVLSGADVALIQHEYGIYPGRDGEELLDLLDMVSVPLTVVAHTILSAPAPHQRLVFEQVLERATLVVVPSVAAQQRLIATHLISDNKVVVIPHGATSNFSVTKDGSLPHPLVLTWGLLGPGKGIEHGVRAMSLLDFPARYVVAGTTHPKVLEHSGEEYRASLLTLAEDLHISSRVILQGGYRSWDDLRTLIRAADVVLLPYDTREQVCSGVLVEALASGKPVVATRFPHAEELLIGGAGILVEQGDEGDMARAISSLLSSPERYRQAQAAAHAVGEGFLWERVGEMFRDTLTSAMLVPA